MFPLWDVNRCFLVKLPLISASGSAGWLPYIKPLDRNYSEKGFFNPKKKTISTFLWGWKRVIALRFTILPVGGQRVWTFIRNNRCQGMGNSQYTSIKFCYRFKLVMQPHEVSLKTWWIRLLDTVTWIEIKIIKTYSQPATLWTLSYPNFSCYSCFTGQVKIPFPPTNVHVCEVSDTYVLLSWTEPDPRGREPLTFHVERVRLSLSLPAWLLKRRLVFRPLLANHRSDDICKNWDTSPKKNLSIL